MKYSILIILLILVVAAPFLGGDGIISTSSFILTELRVPRTLLAFIVGGSLAIVGWVFQIIFRNPLATPYTMGISSIAAFAMAVSELLLENNIIANKNLIFILFYIPMLLIILLSFKKKISREKLLLFGVCIGIFSSSAIVFAQSLLANESVSKLVRWMMGGLEIVGYQDFKVLLPLVLLPIFAILFYRKELTMISIGEEFSFSRGINVEKVNLLLILLANIAVASIVWFCGPIGFVGLIIPHICKVVFGADFSKSSFINFFLGGAFLVLCDLISRTVHDTHVIPVGAITACIGAPLLVYHLLKRA